MAALNDRTGSSSDADTPFGLLFQVSCAASIPGAEDAHVSDADTVAEDARMDAGQQLSDPYERNERIDPYECQGLSDVRVDAGLPADPYERQEHYDIRAPGAQ